MSNRNIFPHEKLLSFLFHIINITMNSSAMHFRQNRYSSRLTLDSKTKPKSLSTVKKVSRDTKKDAWDVVEVAELKKNDIQTSE